MAITDQEKILAGRHMLQTLLAQYGADNGPFDDLTRRNLREALELLTRPRDAESLLQTLADVTQDIDDHWWRERHEQHGDNMSFDELRLGVEYVGRLWLCGYRAVGSGEWVYHRTGATLTEAAQRLLQWVEEE